MNSRTWRLITTGVVIHLLSWTASGADQHSGMIVYSPSAQESIVPQRFRVRPHQFSYERNSLPALWGGMTEAEITFPSPLTTPQVNNNTVHCEYYSATVEGRNPGVVVLHILGGDFELSRLICRSLAANGIHALFVKMPYYGPRRQPGDRARMVSHDVSQTVEAMTQAVQDIRCAAAWLAAQPEVDTTQLGITGISLGGIVSALVAEAEPRIGNVLPVLAGGKFGATAWESDELRGSREFWESQGLTADKLAEMVRDVDPVTHAQNLRGRRMLMINAKRDRVIPPHCAEALWSAAGKPPIIWWNTTHYSAAWRLPEGISRMVQFFSPLEAAGTTFVSPPAERAQKQQPE